MKKINFTASHTHLYEYCLSRLQGSRDRFFVIIFSLLDQICCFRGMALSHLLVVPHSLIIAFSALFSVSFQIVQVKASVIVGIQLMLVELAVPLSGGMLSLHYWATFVTHQPVLLLHCYKGCHRVIILLSILILY